MMSLWWVPSVLSTLWLCKNQSNGPVIWAERGLKAHRRPLFGIVPRAGFEDRRQSAQSGRMDFPGYSISGPAVGESHERWMPCWISQFRSYQEQPYLMGVRLQTVWLMGLFIRWTCLTVSCRRRLRENGTCMTVPGRLVVKNAQFAEDYTAWMWLLHLWEPELTFAPPQGRWDLRHSPDSTTTCISWSTSWSRSVKPSWMTIS